MMAGRLRGEAEGSAGRRERLTVGKRCPEQLPTWGPAVQGGPTGHQAERGGEGLGFGGLLPAARGRRGTGMVTCRLSPLVGERGACDFVGGRTVWRVLRYILS